MRISDFLGRDHILSSFKSDEKGAALMELCVLLAGNGDVGDAGAVFDAMMKRESLGSTGIGDQIAIPHARTPLATSLTGAFGLSRDGIEYSAMDGKPVRLVFMLVAAEKTAGESLKALARVSRLLRSPGFLERIEGAGNAGEMSFIIAEEDEKLG
ncbi:MAG: PTS sugar transporter subunit IIA [Nitrospinae bacterium]|nr:PTS sugar transporter subunit IIA [Nitrospinota bacterium]